MITVWTEIGKIMTVVSSNKYNCFDEEIYLMRLSHRLNTANVISDGTT